MEAIFTWLFAQRSLGWVLFGATWVGLALMIAFGRLVTALQMEREFERDKDTIARQAAIIARMEDKDADKDKIIDNFQLSLRELLDLARAAAADAVKRNEDRG